MDSEFFEHSLLSLEKRYTDILALHDARLNNNSLELEELSSSTKSQIEDLTKQLEAEKRKSLKLIEKLNEELETKIAAASNVN